MARAATTADAFNAVAEPRRRQILDALAGGERPVNDLVAVMRGQPWMRRFDFDTEAVVRLAWRGVTPINLDAPVKYLRADEGGISHFHYGRDNALLTWMHLRLMVEFVLRLPLLIWRRARGLPPFARR
jgi:DNA-binding transcriptional ArsR family regulator